MCIRDSLNPKGNWQDVRRGCFWMTMQMSLFLYLLNSLSMLFSGSGVSCSTMNRANNEFTHKSKVKIVYRAQRLQGIPWAKMVTKEKWCCKMPKDSDRGWPHSRPPIEDKTASFRHCLYKRCHIAIRTLCTIKLLVKTVQVAAKTLRSLEQISAVSNQLKKITAS